MIVTLDTNVLVSGSLWSGIPLIILKLIDEEKIGFVISVDIIKEYNKVMNRKDILEKMLKFNLQINDVVQRIIENASKVNPVRKIVVVKDDPDDNKIIECAVEGNADFIITQDNHLLKLKQYKSIKIITPEEFLISTSND